MDEIDERINIEDYRELRALCVNRPAGTVMTRREALATYEREWEHAYPDLMSAEELAFLNGLIAHEGNGIFNV